METFILFLQILLAIIVVVFMIIHMKNHVGIYQQIKRLEDDVAKGFNDCMTRLEQSRIPPQVCAIQEDKPIINFPKAAKAAKRSYSPEHKAKLSAARKAFWDKKRAAEQLEVTQPPMTNQP